MRNFYFRAAIFSLFLSLNAQTAEQGRNESKTIDSTGAVFVKNQDYPKMGEAWLSLSSGLVWGGVIKSKSTGEVQNFDTLGKAIRACEDQEARLPTFSEYKDLAASLGSSNPRFFPGLGPILYWSTDFPVAPNTVCDFLATDPWLICYDKDDVNVNVRKSGLAVRCVR